MKVKIPHHLLTSFSLAAAPVDNKNDRTRKSSFSMNENNKKLPDNQSVNNLHLY
jgi:hypothetical protein